LPNPFHQNDDQLIWRSGHEVLAVEPWGAGSVRVRAGRHAILAGLPGALLESPAPDPDVQIKIGPESAVLTTGSLRISVRADGLLTASRADTGAELLSEEPAHFWWPPARLIDNGRLEQRFAAYPGERLYGLGQHGHGRFDQKGMVLELQQRNGEVTIPFVVSSRGYGLLWNNPAVGRVELAVNGTRWVADRARQIDYWLTAAETPAEILRRYSDATGVAPALPAWASGFWQSKLRYRDQEELLAVAREHHRRGLPLSVIVVDYLHWKEIGDWSFDPAAWPDPAAMVDELRALGVEPAVSVWPSVSPASPNFAPMSAAGHLIGTAQGVELHASWPDADGVPEGVAFYDATSPEARDYLSRRLQEGYGRYGIRSFWLDACEPEMRPGHPGNLSYFAGPGSEVANLYPREHARGVFEHSRGDVANLARSAWAGSQRYGVVLWSGDIPATFPALAASVRAGLNVAMSGIPWWTTDIGGFHGGDPDDDDYRELVVRWFQFGAFCPVFRLHGHREPRVEQGFIGSEGGPNEVWSFGDEAYAAITSVMRLRERLRPYLHAALAAAPGLPLMRPLLLEFPGDPAAWEIEDQFLFGPDLLVAPVLEAGARERRVYLPSGATWTHAATGERFDGGSFTTVAAPLDAVPLFRRDGAELPLFPEELP
jgi:alpha-D-xyloside xylohydrolase